MIESFLSHHLAHQAAHVFWGAITVAVVSDGLWRLPGTQKYARWIMGILAVAALAGWKEMFEAEGAWSALGDAIWWIAGGILYFIIRAKPEKFRAAVKWLGRKVGLVKE